MGLFNFRKAPARAPNTWANSQRYELEHAIGFMDSQWFRELHRDLMAGRRNVSDGFADPLLLQEWFGGSAAAFEQFVQHIRGRRCLEIGPCVASQMTNWDVAGERHVIEPLLEPIEAWQREHLGGSLYDGFVRHAFPGERFVRELAGQVEGAVLCRNMLDHTPQWPFVLANISAYAAPGCKLLLWTDLDHHGEADEGHYDITSDPLAFKRLVEQLGFTVLREYSSTGRQEMNWGCFAEKR